MQIRSSSPAPAGNSDLFRRPSWKRITLSRHKRSRSDSRIMNDVLPLTGTQPLTLLAEPSARGADFGLAAKPFTVPVEQRPEVEPAIKTVPQGWEDDPTVPLPIAMRPTSPPPTAAMRPNARPRPPPGISRIASVFESAHNKLMGAKDGPRPGNSAVAIKASVAANMDMRRNAPHRAGATSPSPSSAVGASRTNTEISVSDCIEDGPRRSSFSQDQLFVSRPEETLSTPSLASTQSTTSSPSQPSRRNRDRVMGVVRGTRPNYGASKIFLPPNIAEIIPFAHEDPFAAWASQSPRRGEAKGDGTAPPCMWKEVSSPRSSGVKRVWRDPVRNDAQTVYRVGWERDVLDMESVLHECMFDILGGKHTSYPATEAEPRAVLDLGTGSGHWPVSMALQWPNATIVGLDAVPCQTNLLSLVELEKRARSTSDDVFQEEGRWASVARRVKWDQANFLETLPYDSEVFDLVHIRFVGLAVQELQWLHVIEEAVRVLRPGGALEIVDTIYMLPPSAHSAQRNAFTSLLVADRIAPDPSMPIQFTLPTISNLQLSSLKPVFEQTWDTPPRPLSDSLMAWVMSALDYKATSIARRKGQAVNLLATEALRQLHDQNPQLWEGPDTEEVTLSNDGRMSIKAWVVRKSERST